MWYLIVSIPDLCTITYFYRTDKEGSLIVSVLGFASQSCLYRYTDNELLFAFDAYQVHILSFCLLPSLYLHVSIVFVHVSVCACVELEIDIPGNTNKLISVRTLTTFYFTRFFI